MVPSALTESPCFTIARTAELLLVSRPAVRSMIAAGKLKTVVRPYQKRPRVLSSSIEANYREIYEIQLEAQSVS